MRLSVLSFVPLSPTYLLELALPKLSVYFSIDGRMMQHEKCSGLVSAFFSSKIESQPVIPWYLELLVLVPWVTQYHVAHSNCCGKWLYLTTQLRMKSRLKLGAQNVAPIYVSSIYAQQIIKISSRMQT
jgi:hypothetical protein